MKVAFVLPHYPWLPVGLFSVVYSHANQLAARGHNVTLIHAYQLRQVIVAPPDNWKTMRNTWRTLRHWWRRNHPPKFWMPISPAVQITFLAGEPSPVAIPDSDLVIATSFSTAEYVQEYPTSKGTKCYLVQGYETWESNETKVKELWRNETLKKIVVSQWLKDRAIVLGVRHVWYVPNAIDHARFYVEHATVQRHPGIIGLYHRAPVKGGKELLESLSRIHRRFPSIPITLFGVRPRTKLIPPWIRYYRKPSPNLLRKLYNSNTVFVSASYSEGFSLTPAEAMACGCVFVGTDSGGPRDYAVSLETALLSSPGDIPTLCDNVYRVITDESLSARLAQNGRRKVIGMTWDRSGEKMALALTEIVKGHSSDV